MQSEIGQVVEIKDDKVVVQIKPGELCAQCGSQHSCSSHAKNIRKITIQNSINAQVGDEVMISYHPKTRLLSGLVIFIFPVVFGFLGYFIGYSTYGTEGIGILGTFIGFAVAFFVIWLINIIFEKKDYVPKLLKIELD